MEIVGVLPKIKSESSLFRHSTSLAYFKWIDPHLKMNKIIWRRIRTGFVFEGLLGISCAYMIYDSISSVFNVFSILNGLKSALKMRFQKLKKIEFDLKFKLRGWTDCSFVDFFRIFFSFQNKPQDYSNTFPKIERASFDGGTFSGPMNSTSLE